MKIMIIEDDNIQAMSLKFQLNNLNYSDVDVVNNAERAQELISLNYYDLLFCDISMPEVDGIKLLSNYIDVESTGGVIITSAVSEEILSVTRGVCNLLGFKFVGVLSKPFSDIDLNKVIQDFFDSTSSEELISTSMNISAEDIRRCFIEDRFFLLYQPQFDFRSGELCGVEALIRLDHYEYGCILPNHFLSVIEESGFMKELFILTLNKSMQAISSLNSRISLSINVSQSILEYDLCDLILNVCKDTDFSPERVIIELTEEQAYNSSASALSNLARLRLYNIGLAIDDFGTGYASLNKLTSLPFSSLKIDKDFIINVTKNYQLQQVVSLCVRLSHSLGLNCVAEGVEDNETWEFLKELGADICQGFHTGKPMNTSEIKRYLEICEQKNEVDLYDIVGIVFDHNKEKAKAFSSLLSKNLKGAKILPIYDSSDLTRKLRDLPINTIFFDYKSSLSIRDEIENSFVLKAKCFLICDERDKAFDNDKIIIVNSQCDLNKTITEVKKKINSDINGKLANKKLFLLSERELEVSKLLIAGFSNKYISYELGLSQKTVSTYKTRLLQKLGIKNILELTKEFY
ncbi:EAL domain-containing protein [Vibrio owensii]|uniref:EAL domain-containing protein n=1 Tax=Vibrio owensii TaxID=696485 RepID=UPI00339759A6